MDVDVAVIGAGTAGLSAIKEALKFTDKAVLIDHGPLGTTCARVGCMPSKVLIQVADDFFRKHLFAERGILGTEHLSINRQQVMRFVRKLRDYWVSSVIQGMDALKDKMIIGNARFIEPYVIAVNDTKIHAKNIIIATGSTAIIPEEWQSFQDRLLCSDIIFEQESFQDNIAVIGLGIIGLELGQSLSRLGINVTGITRGQFIGGLSDPEVNQVAVEIMAEEFPIYLEQTAQANLERPEITLSNNTRVPADQILLSVGRRPNTEELNLAVFDFNLNERGVPIDVDPTTLQVKGHRVFFPGDVNGTKPLLHEAADEGRIAGFNATQTNIQCFKRRCPLAITFCHPNIAVVGQSYKSLQHKDIIIGTASFDDQGRSRIIGENKGMMRVYADKTHGKLLGAEMIAPEGEHMAHLLAWAMQQQLTIFEVLQKPYYHPSVEEGMRKALRDLSYKIAAKPLQTEMAVCDSSAASGLE